MALYFVEHQDSTKNILKPHRKSVSIILSTSEHINRGRVLLLLPAAVIRLSKSSADGQGTINHTQSHTNTLSFVCVCVCVLVCS